MNKALAKVLAELARCHIKLHHENAELRRQLVEAEADNRRLEVELANHRAAIPAYRRNTPIGGPWDYSRCEGSRPTSEPFFHN